MKRPCCPRARRHYSCLPRVCLKDKEAMRETQTPDAQLMQKKHKKEGRKECWQTARGEDTLHLFSSQHIWWQTQLWPPILLHLTQNPWAAWGFFLLLFLYLHVIWSTNFYLIDFYIIVLKTEQKKNSKGISNTAVCLRDGAWFIVLKKH